MAGAVRSFAVAVAVSLATMTVAWAQDSDLKKEVDQLKKKVAALEAETPAAAKPVAISAEDKASENLMDDLNKWLKEVKLSGFVDVGYVYNVNSPDNGVNGNTGIAIPVAVPAPQTGAAIRAFDKSANAFYLHNAQLMLNKDSIDKSIVGGRIKMSMGQDADVINTIGSPSGDNFEIHEAYVSVLAPLGRGLTLTAGKFATLSGEEVIESKDDLNYSRSLLFFYAIPFTHTGIRATYSLMDKLDVTLGVNNGWDQLADSNLAKTFEFQAVFKATDTWKFISNVYYGAEKPSSQFITPSDGSPGDKRFLIDFVAQGTIDKLTLHFNWDWAFEQDSIVTATGDDNARWTGAAGYVKYQLTDYYAPGIRVEYFRDSDGFRTGTKQTLFDFTLTNQFDLMNNLILRFEIRFDRSSEDIFLSNEKAKGSQATVGFEAIWYF